MAFATEYVGGQDSYSTWGMKWKGEEAETYRIWCSPNFFDVMGIRIIEGRNFTGDTDSGYIINAFCAIIMESVSVLSMTWMERLSAFVRKWHLLRPGRRSSDSLLLYHLLLSHNLPIVYIRLKKGFDAVTAVTHIRQTVARMDAAYPVEVKFYDQLLNSLYQREVRFGTILYVFPCWRLFCHWSACLLW